MMLVFSIVVGQIAPPLDDDLSLVRTEDLEGRALPDALVIRADGRLAFRGAEVTSVAAYVEELPLEARGAIRIVPDRNLAASRLVQVSANLRASGTARGRTGIGMIPSSRIAKVLAGREPSRYRPPQS
ncbi:biopolymer transport protein ExbD [Palleronia aestuarii]|uniref:Biopolymer transport protein ExbD n=1 Tax=Palleronia aestuarii TaxID=568105 RepID=A0A2W7NEF0_9RHOB|nr:biopolymer transporter ExbD [Palleronia aestuarii]PZX15114.1 biopolymer transport protein ExbD [Palleronia aestuarii]